MFSQLGPVFKTFLRQAEHADGRLEIRREEKDAQKRKEDEDSAAEETGGLWEDSTSVSVESLRTFLIEFLKSRGSAIPEENISVSVDAAQSAIATPANTIAARAVKAYTALTPQAPPPPPAPDVQADSAPQDLSALLAADEVRTMYVLIEELERLAQRGVQTLTIEKAETFLAALVNAVAAEKARA
jgi:hypothetical protein